MEKAVSEFPFYLDYQKLDYAGHWRLSDLFSELANVATTHAEMIGVWHPQLLGEYGWVVSKMRIRILKPLGFGTKGTIKTWPGHGSRVVYPRYFEIMDENGDVCIEAVNHWTLLDLKHRRITMPSRIGLAFPDNLKEEKPLQIETDFSEEDGFSFIEKRQVRYSDVDMNQHFNNARYIEWVCDVLDEKKFATHFINDLSIYFKKETAPNSALTLEKKEVGDRFIVLGKQNGEVHFVAEGTWQRS